MATENNIQLQSKLSSEEEKETSLIAFFSVDLADSTKFKTNNRDEWISAVKSFYFKAEKEVTQGIWLKGGRVWKYLGDEVIFCLQITSGFDLLHIAKNCQEALKNIHTAVQENQSELGVKGVLWIADCSEANTATNHIFQTKENQTDYIGPQIDIGFRLGKFAIPGKLLISAETAYLINSRTSLEVDAANQERLEELHIVSFEKLKGVWEGRGYPIIWFGNNLNKEIPYDAHFFIEQNIANSIRFEKTLKINQLDTVFTQANQTQTVNELLKMVKNLPKESQTNPDISEEKLEIHCAAICYNSAKEILILKRSENKNKFKGCWEFGCAQIGIGETFSETIQLAYNKDLNIEVLIDEKHPISTYTIPNSSGSKPGVIFIGSVNDYSNLKLKEEKHVQYMWIKFDELESSLPPEDEWISKEFRNNIEKAFELIYSAKS